MNSQLSVSAKNTPTTRKWSQARGEKFEPNRHWLSRFSSKYKTWRKRDKLVNVEISVTIPFVVELLATSYCQ
ncbi:hypothetical protein MEG05_08500 [Vibrio aestuarianus]|uniref:hypothetical protein n=1 Tax=Vibrio aestuarianus TaxID=28171 RepID=UPI00237CB05C|nr:hypothetical protein [Vibrio aestuarianus]MDE1314238.1 hypothetical protein [Vibrio aestuarianus]